MPLRWFASLAVFLLPLTLFAQTPAPKDETLDQLGKALKPLLISVVPKTLHERTDNWGHQVMVPVGIKWRGVRPQVSKSLRNHAEWKRLLITANDLQRTLDLKIYDVKNVSPEKQTFKVLLKFQMEVMYEQQNWESGLRLWSGSVRARAQVKLDMDCEDTLTVDTKELLPDFVFRMRVTGARVGYDKLVVEHINGIGGDAAKIIGKAAHDVMNQWRPSIERDLLAKASASIVKAADTREIRIGFGSLLKSK